MVLARIWGKISSLGPCLVILPPETMTISSARSMIRSWWEMTTRVASPGVVDGAEGLGELGEGPQVNAGLRLVKIIRPDFRARMVAISMRLTSPPEREASTSRSI